MTAAANDRQAVEELRAELDAARRDAAAAGAVAAELRVELATATATADAATRAAGADRDAWPRYAPNWTPPALKPRRTRSPAHRPRHPTGPAATQRRRTRPCPHQALNTARDSAAAYAESTRHPHRHPAPWRRSPATDPQRDNRQPPAGSSPRCAPKRTYVRDHHPRPRAIWRNLQTHYRRLRRRAHKHARPGGLANHNLRQPPDQHSPLDVPTRIGPGPRPPPDPTPR